MPAPATDEPEKFVAYPGYDADPCYHADTHDAADLCAQWRAAIAAEKAAHEARRAGTWAIVTTLLSIVSLIAVSAALYLTVEANNISRDFGRRQLRAYMTLEYSGFVGINVPENEGGEVPSEASFSLNFNNTGQTPAYDVKSHFDGFVDAADFCPIPVAARGVDSKLSYIVGPNQPHKVNKRKLRSTGELRGAVISNDAWVYIVGAVEYTDAFGIRRRFDLVQRNRRESKEGYMVSLLMRETVVSCA